MLDEMEMMMRSQQAMGALRLQFAASVLGHLAEVDFRLAIERAMRSVPPDQQGKPVEFKFQPELVAQASLAYADAAMKKLAR